MSHQCRKGDSQCVQPFLYGEGIMRRTVKLASCRGREHCQKAPPWCEWFRKSRCPFSLNRWPQQMELVEEAPKCLLELQLMKNKWETPECSDSVPNFYCLVWKPQISSFLLFLSLELSCFESLAVRDTQTRPQASVRLPFNQPVPVLLTELAAYTLLFCNLFILRDLPPNLEALICGPEPTSWSAADSPFSNSRCPISRNILICSTSSTTYVLTIHWKCTW